MSSTHIKYTYYPKTILTKIESKFFTDTKLIKSESHIINSNEI